MSSIINLSLRALQVNFLCRILHFHESPTALTSIVCAKFFFTLLILALDGNIIAEASKGNPSIINYVIFVAVFGMLSLVYLILATIKEDFAIAPMFMVIADGLNTLLFLVGGIALAAYLGVHSCGNHVGFTVLSWLFVSGSRRKNCLLTYSCRTTFLPTKSRMAPITNQRGVERPRRSPRSCGLDSQHSQDH